MTVTPDTWAGPSFQRLGAVLILLGEGLAVRVDVAVRDDVALRDHPVHVDVRTAVRGAGGRVRVDHP